MLYLTPKCEACRKEIPKRVYKQKYCSPSCRVKAARKRYREALQIRVYELLDDVCTCCGEYRPVFLTIDHIHNDGAKERKDGFVGIKLYLKVLRKPERYQILCRNCNWAKRFGDCPHE